MLRILIDQFTSNYKMGCEPHMVDNVLMVIQVLLFLLGRILDDISWHDVGVANEVIVFQSIALGCMVVCIIIQIIRKWQVQGMLKILFFRSQLKFIISWSLIITIAVLFFNIFGCHHEAEQSQIAFFFMVYKECCINVTQLFLTNFNFSLICNTKAVLLEFSVYQFIIFGEIIYNGTLMIKFIRELEGVEKDLSILLISLLIANQILIMDLIFRAAYQDRERQEEKENKLIHHIISAHHFLDAESPNVRNKNQMNGQSQPKIKNKIEGNGGSQLMLALETEKKVTEQPEIEIPNKSHKK